MKFLVAVGAGAALAKVAGPPILDALRIEPQAGFGTDDLVEIAIVVAGAYLVRSIL